MDAQDFLLNYNTTNNTQYLLDNFNLLLAICQESLINYSSTFNTTELDFSNICSSVYLSIGDVVIIICYSIIVVVSIFGNLLVCNIVARRASMRKTTYILIANLALSDLLLTVLNIPFTVSRMLLKDWPFGSSMCAFVPLVQVMSVYVSTFTMMLIALDRYRVICSPFKPKLEPLQAIKAIAFVWLTALLLSLPHAVWNQMETVFSYRPLNRCKVVYPENYSSWITLTTAITQYFLPLSVTGMIYFFIVLKVWSRDVLGAVTEDQLITQAKAKRKTIKMLLLVVVLFAICWLPLNVYNLIREFTTLEFDYSATFYACHWLAMSSVCYNPFIYCWLNKNFRSGAIACFLCIHDISRKLNSSFHSTRDFTNFQCSFPSQSLNSRTSSILQSKDVACCCKAGQNFKHSRSFYTQPCKKFTEESVPMKFTNVVECPSNSVPLLVGYNKGKYRSLPNIQTSVMSQQKLSLKKCLSWN